MSAGLLRFVTSATRTAPIGVSLPGQQLLAGLVAEQLGPAAAPVPLPLIRVDGARSFIAMAKRGARRPFRPPSEVRDIPSTSAE